MEVGMLPSQFLSVVLEESDKNNAHAANVSKNKTSFTISQSVAKNPTPVKRKINGKFSPWPSPPIFIPKQDDHKMTAPIARSDCLDIKKRLPRTVLEECIVELADSPYKTFSPEKLDGSIKDAVIIEPMFSKKNPKPANDKKMKNGSYMRDIFNKVEAVYSDDDEPFLKPSPKLNGNSTHPDSDSSLLAYACDHCPNKYTNKGALWQHNVAAHSVEKSCECQLCGRKFYRNCSLALHMKCHSDEQNCSCKVCGKEFNRLSMLERHVKCHTAEPAAVPVVFTCKICSKKFADEEALKQHVLTHNEKYTCEQCNVTFNTKQLLDLHFHITHKRSETPFACKLCKARFANLRELNEHAASHTYEKLRISCHHCGEVFTQRCTYKKHLQLHIGERLSCNICRIDFTQRSSLLRHYKRLHLINDIPLSNGSNIVETASLTISTK